MKNDSGIRGRWAQSQLNPSARMQANPGGFNKLLDGALTKHGPEEISKNFKHCNAFSKCCGANNMRPRTQIIEPGRTTSHPEWGG
jgi:hypothetical protein